MRCLYLDLDSTLLGPGGSLLHDADGAVSLLGVRAVEACLRAGVEVVLMSGRRRAQLHYGSGCAFSGAHRTSVVIRSRCLVDYRVRR